MQATAHASGIRVIRDEPDVSILRLELEPNRVEWVVFNPGTNSLKLDTIQTSEPMTYLESTAEKP